MLPDLTIVLAGLAALVIAIWWGCKALFARFQRKAAERRWVEATRLALASTPDRLDMIGPLSDEELRELLKQIVFEIGRSGALDWADMLDSVRWVRRIVRERGEAQ
ncbi:hypothetical protein [Microterricola viridarii]|uniref:hypothetical protein n=1 Tax=Microterricola viridarii TaxID=412690 RepID=UPI0009F3FACB|nr:hypothetical protein [Microterricola viridarii]